MRLFTSSEPVRGQSVAAWPTLSVWGGRGREQVQKGGGPAGTLFVRVQFLRLVDAGRRLLFFCITLEFPLFLLGGRGQRHGRKRRRVLLGRPAFSLQLTIDSIFVCVMNMGSPVKFLHSTRPQPRHTLADTHTHTHTHTATNHATQNRHTDEEGTSALTPTNTNANLWHFLTAINTTQQRIVV